MTSFASVFFTIFKHMKKCKVLVGRWLCVYYHCCLDGEVIAFHSISMFIEGSFVFHMSNVHLLRYGKYLCCLI